MNKAFSTILCCCLMLSIQLAAQKNAVSISNKFLKVVYQTDKKILEVTDQASGNTFLQQGYLLNAGDKAVVSPVHHADFGDGRSLRILKGEGGDFAVTLYNTQPFVFIQETIANSSSQSQIIVKKNSFSFSVDLQKKAGDIKTLGTGGLLPAFNNPGSYLFLTTVDPSSRKGVITGWLTNERGSGVIFSDTLNGRVKISTQIDYGRLLVPAGKTISLETLMVGFFSDARAGEELFAGAIAKNQHIQLPERKAVYCSWYSEKNGGAGNSASTRELAQFASAKLKDYGLGTIQLDDQWQDGEIFNGPARGFEKAKPGGPYPNGMEEPASVIKKSGLTAGIWWMPFARNHQAPEYRDRQHWFARRLEGKPYETTWGGTSLDLTNPEVKQHIAGIATSMKTWGYRYFKMDGLWTGTVTEQVYINDGYKDDHIGNCLPLYDSTKTQIEAFRSGLQLLRTTVGREVFFSGCCVSQNMRSFGASIGLVDAMRVGPDFNHDGQSIRTGAIRASRLYFLNGRVWWNDPDPSIIRETGSATADGACKGIGSLTRARLLPSWVALSGQFFLGSDWLPDLPEERLDIMKKCMASHNGMARPVDAFDKTLPSIWLASGKGSGNPRNIIGLFNWDTTLQTIGTNAAWAGLKANVSYYAFDFWGQNVLPNVRDSFNYSLPSESCMIIALRERTNHPVLVSTSAHITQGMVDVTKEKWEANTLTGESRVIAGDDYELRIAGINDGGIRKLASLQVDAMIKEVTIEQLPSPNEGWLRLKIHSKQTGTVKWMVRFARK